MTKPTSFFPSSKATTRLQIEPGELRLELETRVEHGCDRVWQVITDYGNLGKFMPNLSSRRLRSSAASVFVEQVASSSLIPLLQFRLTLEFRRPSANHLYFRRISGNLKRFDGCWSVSEHGNCCSRINYVLHAEHGFPLPAFLLAPAIRTEVDQIMPAIETELNRRHQRNTIAQTFG